MSEPYVHPTSCVDEGAVLAQGVKIWHFCHISGGAQIGEDTVIGQNCFVGNNVRIHSGVKLQNNVSVYEGVELMDHVFCGPSCVFTNDINPRAKYPKGSENYKKTVVHVGATIGANATIVCGNNIGKWAMVAAGAVVTRDVAPYAMVAGVPARRIGWVCECGQALGELICESCGRKYAVDGEGLCNLET